MDEAANNSLQYALLMRVNMLRREGLPRLSVDELSKALTQGKWKVGIPSHTSIAVGDIMAITADDVVNTLTRLALTESSELRINEFDDLMGGKEDE